MSLINDALKRARSEALRQEEGGRKADYRAVPAHSRRPDRQRVLMVAGWIVAGLALAAVLWLWIGSDGEPAVTSDEVSAGVRAVASSSPADVDPAEDESLGAEGSSADPERSVPSPQVDRAVTSESPPEPSSDTDLEASEESSAIVEAVPVGSNPAPEPDRPSTAPSGLGASPNDTSVESRPLVHPSRTPSGLEAGATYLRRVRSEDGSVAELGGIAYSESRPIAVINGSVVSNGDLIAGFTVVSVEPERVELEANGVRFFLALH